MPPSSSRVRQGIRGVADQALLDSLHAAYPDARIAHAFASTEAGVAFDVDDGRAGFPQALIDVPRVKSTSRSSTIRFESGPAATPPAISATCRPFSSATTAMSTPATGSSSGMALLFQRPRGRRHQRRRPQGISGRNRVDTQCRSSRPHVLGQGAPQSHHGAVVVADVVLANPANAVGPDAPEHIKNDLLDACRRSLAAHKVPAMLRFVPSLEFTAAGKLVRPGA